MAGARKHLRSSTADKRPTTAIEDGQLAVNTNAASPGLFFKDSTGATIIKVGPVHVGTTAPNAVPPTGGSSGNSSGEVWLDISLTPPGVKIWDGSAWVNATPAGSTTVQGLLELATNAETQAGSDATRAVTPAGLQSKVSDSISTASSTTIASSAAVKIAYDLANAALPKSGGTVTGNLEIGTTGTLTFEGSTADGFETTLAAADPTADRTITLPNTTGTVITTGDSGTVTSTMIADGTIVNADINASAAIALSKLATGALPSAITVSSTNIVDGTIVNADVNASAAIAGTKISPNFGGQNVVTTGSVTGASLIPTSSTVPTNGLYLPAANNVALSTNGTGQVFITSNGNAGIGTVSASNVAGKLHLRADGDESKALLVLQNRDTGGSAGGAINFVNGAVDLSDNRYSYIRGIVTGAGQNGNHLVFGTNENGQAPIERARIDSSGRLLVGTSTSYNAPSITGTQYASLNQIHSAAVGIGSQLIAEWSNATATGGSSLKLAKSNSGTVGSHTALSVNMDIGSIVFAASDGTSFINAASILSEVDGTPSLNDMPGRLVFSTTADGASSPTERMIIYNDGRIAAYSGNGTPYILSSTRTAASFDRIISLRHSATSMLSATESLTVKTNGNVENTNNSYGALSDIKLKENIVDANSQWDDIKALQVRKYNFKEGQTHTQIGLVAQEVELVSPGLVSESPDRDEDGNDLGTVTKSVNYSVLYMKAVKALQEAMERIEALEQRLNDAGL